jgi:hypothetical protein
MAPDENLWASAPRPVDRDRSSLLSADSAKRKVVNMSVLLSDAGTSLELQRSPGMSVDEFGDVYVAVRLVTARFNAPNDTVWIAVAARDHLLAALNALEQSRNGEARVDAMPTFIEEMSRPSTQARTVGMPEAKSPEPRIPSD